MNLQQFYDIMITWGIVIAALVGAEIIFLASGMLNSKRLRGYLDTLDLVNLFHTIIWVFVAASGLLFTMYTGTVNVWTS